MNKDPESWSRVTVDAVMDGSEVQVRNVLQMALDDIRAMAAESTRLRNENAKLRTEVTGLGTCQTCGGDGLAR